MGMQRLKLTIKIAMVMNKFIDIFWAELVVLVMFRLCDEIRRELINT